MRLSTTPVWTGGGFSPRPMTLRAFAVATSDAYAVMPGALTRIAAAAGARATEARQPQIVSMQRGGGSKDTWVLADGPVPHVTLLRPVGAPVELKRGGIDLPSRVADNLYWLGRYGERAEDTARLLRAGVLRLADDPGSLAGREFGALVRALRQTGHLPAEDDDEDDDLDIGARFLALIHDPALPCGLPATLRGLHRAAFAVRDRLSNDTWRIVNHLDQQLGRRAPGAQLGDDLVLLNRVVVELAALAAMGMENTTRGPGWRFLDIGRRLERALFTCDLLRALHRRRCDARGRRPGGRARRRRQRHHLPQPLPHHPAAGAGPGPAADRRQQPARGGLPARRHRRARRRPAAAGRPRPAQHRGAPRLRHGRARAPRRPAGAGASARARPRAWPPSSTAWRPTWARSPTPSRASTSAT